MSVISAISLVSFVIWELGERRPIVACGCCTGRNFAIGTLCDPGLRGVFCHQHHSAARWRTARWATARVGPGLPPRRWSVLPLVMTPVIGRYASNFDLRILASLSFLTMGASCLIRAQFATDVDFRTIAEVQLFIGDRRRVFLFMPITTIVLSNLNGAEVAENRSWRPSSACWAARLRPSLTTWIWSRREVFHHASLTESVSAYNPAAVDKSGEDGRSDPAAYGADR